MKLSESPIQQDEMINDAYPVHPKPEAGALVFEGRYIEKQVDETNPAVTIQAVDIVENFNLQPYDLKHAAFIGWVKQFMPKRKIQLEQSNPGKVAEFMNNAKKFATYISQHFADFEFFM
jgi:hypothetical protein